MHLIQHFFLPKWFSIDSCGNEKGTRKGIPDYWVIDNHSITSASHHHFFFLSYYCSFVFLSVPWLLLEKPAMEVSQIQFNFWIFFSNALCALALNFSIFLVIGRTGAVTIRVAGVLKDWILIALSTVIFPESIITRLNIIGYAIGSSSLIFSGSSNLQLHIVHIDFKILVNQLVNLSCSFVWCRHVQLHKGQGCACICISAAYWNYARQDLEGLFSQESDWLPWHAHVIKMFGVLDPSYIV